MRTGIRKRPGQIVRGRRGGKPIGGKSERPAFTVTPSEALKGGVAPREAMEHYWHPNRAGVELAPPDFLAKLREMHVDLHCTRPPERAPIAGGPAWLFWYRRPRVTHALSPGWWLLFSWRNAATGQPEPLDERCFAVLYGASAMKHGNGEQYFKRCVEQKLADDKAARDRAFQNHRKAKQRDFASGMRISSAGTGSKFARHHDGTTIPSRSQQNWLAETRRNYLPPEMIAAEDEAREVQRARTSDVKRQIRHDLGITVK